MENQTKELTRVSNTQQPSIYNSADAFNNAQRMAQQLAQSDLVPAQYKGNVSNTLVALELAYRTGNSPLMVMQNMNVIHGKPSWSSSYIIASLNSCGRFTPLQWHIEERGTTTLNAQGQATRQIPNKVCYAFAKDQEGNTLKGPEISVETAIREGWYSKSGSKWPNMTDLMLQYRAAAFFGRLYAPDVLMGMQSYEEVVDVNGAPTVDVKPSSIETLNSKVANNNPPKTDEAIV